MANYPGVLVPLVTTYVQSNNAQPYTVAGLPDFNKIPNAYKSSDPLAAGNLVHNHQTPKEEDHDGVLVYKYSDIFYNRVLVNPSLIALGDLVTEQQITVNVTNLFFTSKTLTSIDGVNVGGINIDGDSPPVSFGALQTFPYIVTVTTDGPPSINASYTFSFDAVDPDPVLSITGNRSLLFPYLFSDNSIETLTWNTNIIESYNGKEQRIKVKDSPRRKYQVSSYISGSEFARAGNLMYGWRGRSWVFPVFHEQRGIDLDIVSGNQTIQVSTINTEFTPGGFGVLYLNSRVFEVFEIDSITLTSITAVKPFANNYPSGTICVPARSSVILKDPTRNTPGYDSKVNIVFSLLGIEGTPDGSPSDIQYKNIDTIPDNFEILSSSIDNRITYNQRVDVVDYDTGLFDVTTPWKYTKLERQIRFIAEGLEEIWELRKWFSRRQGRLEPFWMPSFEPDLVPVTTGIIVSTMVVKDNEHARITQYRNNVRITKTDGTELFRSITGSAQTETDGEISISFNSPLGFDASEIVNIEYLGVNRLNTDNVRFQWLSNSVVIVDVQVKEISPDVVY